VSASERRIGADGLTTRVFRALYPQFDLRTVNGTLVVVPKGTPWFSSGSLGNIARQISENMLAENSATQTGHARTSEDGTARP
jgi:hypothetical protein